MATDKSIFSTNLKKLRQEHSLSQKDFGESISVSAMAISSYESGAKSPSIDTVYRIAETYNVSIDWLCGLSSRKQSEITAMSDVLKLLFDIEKNTPLEIFSNREVINQNIFNPNEYPDLQELEVHEICFLSGLLDGYIDEWNKMRTLYKNGTIDDELYSLWKEKVLNQTSCTYPNGTKIVPDVPE